MKTKGSTHVTATTFAKVRHLQTNSAADWREIQRLVGHGETTQRKIKRAGTWKRWQELQSAHKLQAKAARRTEKLAVKKQIIERNTKRKAQQVAIADQIDSNRVYALEERVAKLADDVLELRKQLKTVTAWIEQDPLDEDELNTALAAIPADAPLDPDFLIADAEHNKVKRRWFGRGRA